MKFHFLFLFLFRFPICMTRDICLAETSLTSTLLLFHPSSSSYTHIYDECNVSIAHILTFWRRFIRAQKITTTIKSKSRIATSYLYIYVCFVIFSLSYFLLLKTTTTTKRWEFHIYSTTLYIELKIFLIIDRFLLFFNTWDHVLIRFFCFFVIKISSYTTRTCLCVFVFVFDSIVYSILFNFYSTIHARVE